MGTPFSTTPGLGGAGATVATPGELVPGENPTSTTPVPTASTPTTATAASTVLRLPHRATVTASSPRRARGVGGRTVTAWITVGRDWSRSRHDRWNDPDADL